jgi:predicted NBD/HSP70 family sugar kinase
MVVYAAVEGGGTTFRAAIAEGTPENILDRAEFETTTPEETLSQVKAWLNESECAPPEWAVSESTRPRVALHRRRQQFR